MLTYRESITKINIAEAVFLLRCELADTVEEINHALEILHKAKQTHRTLFGSLRRTDDGDWY